MSAAKSTTCISTSWWPGQTRRHMRRIHLALRACIQACGEVRCRSGVLPREIEEACRSLSLWTREAGTDQCSVTKLQPLRVTLIWPAQSLSMIIKATRRLRSNEVAWQGENLARSIHPSPTTNLSVRSFIGRLRACLAELRDFLEPIFSVTSTLICSNILVEFIPAASFLATVIN
jgi:hypothetical protein